MFTTNNAEETAAVGAEYARQARAGDLLALRGDLGAGKTQFVKGFVAGMGSDSEVTSPTFTLIHEYSGGRLPVYHFDWYRLGSAAEAARLGLDEYLFGEGVCLVEWADRFPELLPAGVSWITFTTTGECTRLIQLSSVLR